MTISSALKKKILKAQQNEINEYQIYSILAKHINNKHNKKILEKIAKDELKHYYFRKQHTQKELKPQKWRVRKFVLIAKLFGLTFGVRLAEQGEQSAQAIYKTMLKKFPETQEIIDDEEKHEHELISMIDEDFLKYVGSIVLGLNDALVELTGALAGLSLALQDTKMIALSGLVMGIAASFSMAGSEYLSNKSDNNPMALRASIYTGLAYVITVILLILPYFIFNSYITALTTTISTALLIILVFNYYISVAKRYNFKKRFIEMAIISMSVTIISFLVGFGLRKWLGV